MAWKAPAIGDLRERVTLLQPLPQTDVYGNQAPALPLAAGEEWARVEELEAEEILSGAAVRSRRRIAVTLHWREDVQGDWTLQWDTATWQIGAIFRDPARAWLRLLCTAVEGVS